MRLLSTLFLIFFTYFGLAQNTASFDSLLTLGKGEFKKPFQEQDYSKAKKALEEAVKLKPNHPEANYFLAYTYSRLNSKDGKSMIRMNLPLTMKFSKTMEKVIKHSPKYEGEMVLLDPYSKMTSEWGSQAMSFWHNGKKDSAIWAFQEGKKHGGFNEFILELNRKVLDLCDKNAILISSGDNFTIPLWYLQIVENYRNDVSVVDVSLLATKWYPSYLLDNKIVDFDLSKQDLEALEYISWTDSVITIQDFSWTVKPSYYGKYLLRNDLVFLSLLRKNKFNRKLYFTTAFNEGNRLSLKNYITQQILADKLDIEGKTAWNYEKYLSEIKKILPIVKKVNKNSQDEVNFVRMIRLQAILKVSEYLNNGKKTEAKELLKLVDQYISENEYSFSKASYSQFWDSLRTRLE